MYRRSSILTLVSHFKCSNNDLYFCVTIVHRLSRYVTEPFVLKGTDLLRPVTTLSHGSPESKTRLLTWWLDHWRLSSEPKWYQMLMSNKKLNYYYRNSSKDQTNIYRRTTSPPDQKVSTTNRCVLIYWFTSSGRIVTNKPTKKKKVKGENLF